MGKPTATRKLSEKPDNLKRVKRCLFGRPNPTDTKKFLQEQIHRIHETNKSKWNFDFEQDKPLPGRFDWHIIDGNKPRQLVREVVESSLKAQNQEIIKQKPSVPVLSCSGYFKHKTPSNKTKINVSSPPVKPTPGSASKRHNLRSKTSTPKRNVLRSSDICLIGSNSPLGQGKHYPILSPGIIEHAGLQTSITDYAKRTRRTNSSKTPQSSPARIFEAMLID